MSPSYASEPASGPATTTSLERLFPAGIQGKHIHAVGAGGSGISAVLRLAAEHGALVTGCDVAETTMARHLNAAGIPVVVGHDPAHIQGADLVVTTPAVTFLDAHHPELEVARAASIPVVQWQALLGYLMRGSVGVSVAGVHGKGSTTALLGALAIAGGLDPTVEVGAVVRDWGGNLRLGRGAYFINEADEFNYNFLNYTPRVAVLTAVEFDHPEFFENYEAIRDAFVRFLRRMETTETTETTGRGEGAVRATLILNADSPGCRDVLAQLRSDAESERWRVDVRTFGIESDDADVRAEDMRDDAETSFELCYLGTPTGRVVLQMPGRHNVYNALAATAAAGVLGVAPSAFVPALSAFGGLRRRFELVPDGDVLFVDDYAHHPHAVQLTLQTVRRRFPDRRIVAVFQPTLYTRLYRFLEPFSAAFDEADAVVIVETQPSRERDTGLVHGRDLVARIQQRAAFADRPQAVRYGGDFDETAALLRSLRQPGDVIAVMGSGPVNKVIAGARLQSRS